MQLIQSNSKRLIDEYPFFESAEVLASIDVDSEEIRSYGGFKGVNTLTNKFTEALISKGIL